MNIIAPIQPIPPANTATTQTTPHEARVQELRPEQVVRATVAEGGKDHVFLELNQRLIRAETRVPLRTGQTVNVQILSTSPRLELRLLDDSLAERLNRHFHLLGGRWSLLPPVRELLGGANPLFDRLSPAARVGLEIWVAVQGFAYERPDREFLRHLSRRFGLDLEARLARGEGKEGVETLKGALLEVLQKLQGEKGEIADRIGRLLQSLEVFQLCQAKLAEAGLQLLPLPLPWLHQGYLLADRGEKGADDESSFFRLSLHLCLEGLGNLRIDFLQDDQGLYLRMAGESMEKAGFLSRHQDELKASLGALLQGVTFAQGAENPAATLLRRVLGEESGRLNTKV